MSLDEGSSRRAPSAKEIGILNNKEQSNQTSSCIEKSHKTRRTLLRVLEIKKHRQRNWKVTLTLMLAVGGLSLLQLLLLKLLLLLLLLLNGFRTLRENAFVLFLGNTTKCKIYCKTHLGNNVKPSLRKYGCWILKIFMKNPKKQLFLSLNLFFTCSSSESLLRLSYWYSSLTFPFWEFLTGCCWCCCCCWGKTGCWSCCGGTFDRGRSSDPATSRRDEGGGDKPV